jgi:hypothetical protein
MRRRCGAVMVMLLVAVSVWADGPLALVSDGPAVAATPGVQRVLVRQFATAPAAPETWPLVELFGPLPDAQGQDLLAAHADWLALGADGQTRLAGTPCYGLPEVRQARAAQVAALAQRGAAGVCLSALPRADWPAKTNVAQGFGFNPVVVERFRARYHRDPVAAAEGSVDRALLVGLQAEAMGELLRAIRQQGPQLKLALACARADLTPYGATGAALDVAGYVRQGLLDEVMVSGALPPDLMGLKLQTDGPLPGWAWCAAPTPAALRPTVVAALRATGRDGIVVQTTGTPEEITRLVRETEAAWSAQRDTQAALEAAIATGELKQVAGCTGKGKEDQATVHGVAQSFRVEAATLAAAVGLLVALRGPDAYALAPLAISLRADAGGKPADETLATATLAPDGLSAEPSYRWAYARLNHTVTLQPGTTYWLYVADPRGATSSVMWRLAKGGDYDGGQAWSSKYDYSAHDWAFGIFAEGK